LDSPSDTKIVEQTFGAVYASRKFANPWAIATLADRHAVWHHLIFHSLDRGGFERCVEAVERGLACGRAVSIR